MERQDIFLLIEGERERQEKLHAKVDSELYMLAVLTEEIGEVAKAVQEGTNVVEELIQVAAVAIRWLENRP